MSNEQPASNNGNSGRKTLKINKEIFSWALYDFANSVFATTVMAAFFPIFFKDFWAKDLANEDSTLALGAANSAASLIVAASAPILGAIADTGGHKKNYLLTFAFMGALGSGALFFIGPGMWVVAAAVFVICIIGFAGANIFYDAMIIDVTKGRDMDYVSSFGFSLGYLGGTIMLVVNVLMVTQPSWFGLANSADGVRYSFAMTSVWWILFTIPLIKNVHEKTVKKTRSFRDALSEGFSQLKVTFHSLRKIKPLILFLVAYIFYIDGVNTIIKMAVSFGKDLGFDTNSLITALVVMNFVAFPAALGFGYIGRRWGAKLGIYLALVVYCLVTVFGYTMTTVSEFYALAGVIGLVQGGIQALSRSYYASMVPPDRSAEFFGFFNLLGKFSAILGPIMMGLTASLTGDARSSILVILFFFAAGLYFMWQHEKSLRPI